MFPEDMFENRHYTFKKGSEIIFYTDGLEMEGIADRLLSLDHDGHFDRSLDVIKDMCKGEAQDDRTWVAFKAF